MVGESATARKSKRERLAENGGDTVILDDHESTPVANDDDNAKRRTIRSHYRELENRITEHKDELAKATSNKFLTILNEVDNIHQHVTKPREQVSDAETLLGLVNTFTSSVKSNTTGGVTPSEFISCLINQFTKRNTLKEFSKDLPDILWHDIGSFVSPFLRESPRCMTMSGPMDSEIKIRKTSTRAKRTKPVGNARPDKVEKADEVETDTVRNMRVIFRILTEKKAKKIKVQLENLILNRNSFAQTVENLFALSFLVKDGRVIINVDEDGSHVVVPTNAPREEQIKNGEVKSHHFIFRFDFRDWKLMKNLVVEGEELMPHRNVNTTTCPSQAKANAYTTTPCPSQTEAGSNDEDVNIPQAIPINSQTATVVEAIPISYAFPVKKFSRNYGHIMKSCSDLSDAGKVTIASLRNGNGNRKRNGR